jgi:POT family proton-dependent oligopeptide transporter
MNSSGFNAGRGGRTFGHPRGLLYIAGTELWDRISFHGMQALLVLYMVEQLLLPGHVEHVVGFGALRTAIEFATGPLSAQALAFQIFGLYVGLVYFTPVFGGALGDRVLGRVRTITLGALLMTAGHFCLAFDQSFLLALLFLISGAGCLRGNLSPQVGELYAKDDRRRTTAFQIYGAMINAGAFIAPIVTGQLAKSYSWHFGFAFAGFGMLVGLAIYLSGRPYLPPDPPQAARLAAPPLTPGERRIVRYLIAMLPVAMLFWIAQSQIWNTYNIWVRDHLNLTFGTWTMPVPWLQSLDGLAPFVCLPPMVMLWRWQAKRGREPNEFTKMAIGCWIFGASTLLLAAASAMAGATGRASILWAVAFHFASNIGWIFFAPTTTALVSRAAPDKINATMIGAYSLAVFAGSVISGRLGSLYERWPPSEFWLLHAAIVSVGGVLVLAFGALMRPALRQVEPLSVPAGAPLTQMLLEET